MLRGEALPGWLCSQETWGGTLRDGALPAWVAQDTRTDTLRDRHMAGEHV